MGSLALYPVRTRAVMSTAPALFAHYSVAIMEDRGPRCFHPPPSGSLAVCVGQCTSVIYTPIPITSSSD